jgi:hypothetical protein
MFLNMAGFCVKGFSVPSPTPKLENHPLSAVRSGLFNIFSATLRIWRPFLHPQPKDAPYLYEWEDNIKIDIQEAACEHRVD